LAALATVGAAQAQSSVTVSGRMDLGYSSKELDVRSTTNSNTKTDTIGANSLLTSFIAVSGSEDLGQGNRARFHIETGMDGSTATTLGGRGFWTELSGNWGELRAGLQNTGARDIWTSMIQTGAINVVGDLNSSTAEDAGGTAGHTAYGTAIKYTTPSFNGLRVSASISKANVNTTGAKTGGDATSFGAFYTAGKLSLAGSYQKSTTDTAAVTGQTGTLYCANNAAGASWSNNAASQFATACPTGTFQTGGVPYIASAAAFSTDVKTTAAGAMYDLGFLRASAIYMKREEQASNATVKALDRDSTTLSVSAPVGKAVLFASYGFGDNVTNGTTKADLKSMQLGGRYFLSKRTYAYLATGQVKHEVSATSKNDYKETAVGMLHLF